MIEIRDLTVVLGGRTILEDVSFDAPAGGFTALIGPNGSGKTTLVRTLFRAVVPASGTIRIAGRGLDDYDQQTLARTVAVLRQEPDLAFDFTAEELVLAGRSPYKGLLDLDGAEDHRIVDEVLRMTDAYEFKHRSFATLSGGERQRVLLARALAQQPEVLVLDEPTNHLDIRHRLEVLGRVKSLGVTVLAAIHDLALADRFATHAVMLSNGRVHREGTPSDVLTEESIREVFGVGVTRHEGGLAFSLLDEGAG